MKKAFKETNLFAVATLGWALATFGVLAAPVSPQMHNGVFATVWFDKLVHACLFGVLYFLAIRSFGPKTSEYKRIGTLAAVGTYGILCEGAQLYLKHRSFDVVDIIANIMGSLVVYILIKRI